VGLVVRAVEVLAVPAPDHGESVWAALCGRR
jgi:hypothetical protein